MADEDELLDEAAGDQLGNNIVDGFDHMHGPRRRISPHSDVIRSLKLPAPNKEQVLNYVANTKSVHIRRAGTELQVNKTFELKPIESVCRSQIPLASL
jgi:hypothetical protein